MRSSELIQSAQRLLISGGRSVFDALPFVLEHILDERAWAEACDRKSGQPFPSFQAFAQHPLPEGLETPYKRLLYYCDDRPKVRAKLEREVGESATHAEAGAKGGRGNKASDNVTSFSDRGNELTYTLRRLKRDRPDLFERVVGRELSANAAAIEAGFRVKTYTLPHDIERWAAKARAVFSVAELEVLKKGLS